MSVKISFVPLYPTYHSCFKEFRPPIFLRNRYSLLPAGWDISPRNETQYQVTNKKIDDESIIILYRYNSLSGYMCGTAVHTAVQHLCTTNTTRYQLCVLHPCTMQFSNCLYGTAILILKPSHHGKRTTSFFPFLFLFPIRQSILFLFLFAPKRTGVRQIRRNFAHGVTFIDHTQRC